MGGGVTGGDNDDKRRQMGKTMKGDDGEGGR